MALIEIDVVGLQALEGGVDLLVDLLAGEAAARLVHREEELRGEDELLASEALEDFPPGRLRRAGAVDVGGVEEVDADLEGGAGAGLGLLALHPTRVGEPGAERDLRDLEVRVAEPAELHRRGPYPTGFVGNRE